jgi:hypothetical protein
MYCKEVKMATKTEGVRLFVQDVLRADFSEPYGEDIIRDVCFAIEKNSEWRKQYESLKDELSRDVVNTWLGKYVKEATGLKNVRVVSIGQGHIITAYTKLGY